MLKGSAVGLSPGIPSALEGRLYLLDCKALITVLTGHIVWVEPPRNGEILPAVTAPADAGVTVDAAIEIRTAPGRIAAGPPSSGIADSRGTALSRLFTSSPHYRGDPSHRGSYP